MRITHILPAVSKESSGPSYSVVRLCEVQASIGEEPTLASLMIGKVSDSPSFLRVFPLGIGLRRLGPSPAMFRWLDSTAKAKAVDVLHCHGMWQMNSLYPGWVARLRKVPLVVSPRGAFSSWAMRNGSVFKTLFWPLLQKPAVAQASCFHATAESEYDDIRRLGFKQPVAIIPNGIDIPPLKPKQRDGQRTLLFLGRIHPKKGLDILLTAWQQVQFRFPQWRLVIAGSDDEYFGANGYLDELQILAEKLDLKRIYFVGELRGDQKAKAYSDAELFVLPTYSENFGMTVAEALAAGTPAIVSKGAPWSGLVTNHAGWWAEVGGAPLVACLEVALSSSQADLNAMGLRGRRWMASDFSWERIGSSMVDTYRWLLDRSLPVPAWVQLK